MAVTAKLFGKALLALANEEIDWEADAIKVVLCASEFTPAQDTMDYYDDVTNELTTASGYTAGGATITTTSAIYTASTNILMLDGADVSWADSCITARYAVVYDSTPGTAGTDPLICWTDFVGNVISSSGTFTVSWGAQGIVAITAA